MSHPLFRYSIAASGGVLWGLCFGKSPLSLAAWIALAPLLLLLSAPRPGRLGWVHGYAAWMTGLYWISFLVLLTSVAVAAAVQRRRWEPAAIGLLVPLLLLPLAGRWSLRQDVLALREMPDLGRAVRLLQPNIPNLVQFDDAAVIRNYQKVIGLSMEACQPGALVVWPESAAWPFLYRRDAMLDADLARLADRGCTVLFNSGWPVGDTFYNSAFLVSPSGEVFRYDKRHLVPFGEYVPFRGVFGWMDKLARNAGEMRPADRTVLLPWDGEKIGMAICYEVVFPSEVAALVQQGATLLVTITNDAWYGDTSAPWQHFRAARFRAAESRRPLLRAAITGVSAWVDPDGSVREELGVNQEGIIRARVLGQRRLTPFSRCPWLVPFLCTILAGAAFGVYFATARSRRS